MWRVEPAGSRANTEEAKMQMAILDHCHFPVNIGNMQEMGY